MIYDLVESVSYPNQLEIFNFKLKISCIVANSLVCHIIRSMGAIESNGCGEK